MKRWFNNQAKKFRDQRMVSFLSLRNSFPSTESPSSGQPSWWLACCKPSLAFFALEFFSAPFARASSTA